MKFLIVFALTLATVSARQYDTPVFLRDAPAPKPHGRITNGETATEGQFPYQAGLVIDNSKWCGGSLIKKEWVLTAAHCTIGASIVDVNLGSTVRLSPKVTRTSKQIIVHAGYNPNTLANDISLIEIAAVTLSNLIAPIALPTNANSNYADDTAVASGWGKTSDSSGIAKYLQYVELPVITNAKCAERYGTQAITNDMICAATPDDKSTCNGDSGGPLVLLSDPILIGITSFGTYSCTSGAPAGFTRVTSYLNWIETNTQK